jgi:S1-C subfamily serine protease
MVRFLLCVVPPVFLGLALAHPAGGARPQPPDKQIVPRSDGGKGRPFLGVSSVLTSTGARITHVFPDSPAAKLGLEVGDHIVEIDGYPVGLIDGLSFSPESEIRRARGTLTLKVRDRRTGKVQTFADVRVGGGTSAGGGSGGLPDDESDRLGGRR